MFSHPQQFCYGNICCSIKINFAFCISSFAFTMHSFDQDCNLSDVLELNLRDEIVSRSDKNTLFSDSLLG